MSTSELRIPFVEKPVHTRGFRRVGSGVAKRSAGSRMTLRRAEDPPVPLPMEYQHASDDFERFLADARERADLVTRNQTWTMVDAVFRVFRRRLTVAEGLSFAEVLPPLLRAMFVVDWDIAAAPLPFASREAMTAEVQAVRGNHNFAPDTAIACVAAALRTTVDMAAFEKVLGTLPVGARDYWTP
jgi:uncharacterized protein (DUF2267 family)